jgi:hypothetical protein
MNAQTIQIKLNQVELVKQWIGAFTTEKLFRVETLDSFKPDIVWIKNEIEFKTSGEMVVRAYNT